jgi:hypothetical protein
LGEGRITNGQKREVLQLQKELGLSIGPKDPLLALWVSKKSSLKFEVTWQSEIAFKSRNSLIRG